MKRIITSVALLGASALAAGCWSQASPGTAGNSAPTSPAAAPSPSPIVDYQQQYLTDVAPYNAAVNKINPNATSATDPTIQAVGAASLAFSRVLLQQSWPANAEADVHTLAIASAKIAADISQGADMDFTNFANDGSTATADAQTVRADLGLPAASESP